MKILVADHDRGAAIHVRRLAEQQGHEAAIAESGKEAWKRLRTETFAAAILLWQMPDIDGLELMRRVRANGAWTPPYMILLTTTQSLEERQEGFDGGVDDYLAKPVDANELHARLCVAERMLSVRAQVGMETNELARLKAELERVTQLHERTSEDVGRFCRDLELANAQLKAQSITDGLTGLKNHREFQERLQDEVSRAARYHLPLSLMMLDVDHFKLYNDSYGHPAGDEVLKMLAKVLESQARETDIIARYGGEEFAVILANTDRDQALSAAERLRLAVSETCWPLRPVTVSIGISTLRILTNGHSDLVKEADIALYASKGRGRNRISHYNVPQTAFQD